MLLVRMQIGTSTWFDLLDVEVARQRDSVRSESSREFLHQRIQSCFKAECLVDG